uniref:kunitz trypsin inhibitor 5-like n=1 Tax=Erigeron canadensis TaxID=72917 RepID=UPI001CB92188|nr:kunitz trypsin inhibitor 5-like [Erigeron canadensis]
MKDMFIIFVFLSVLSLSSCEIFRPAAILDTDRNVLRSGTNYYILPVMHGKGGGLTLASDGGQTCPLEVVQEVSEGKNGLPVNFASANKDGIIRESIDLNIKFVDSVTCAPNMVWQVNYFNRKGTVSSKGTLGRPGQDTMSNWFKIQKYEDHYKLVHCPSVCYNCKKPACSDVGSMVDEKGRRSLVLSNEPLKVIFKRA